MIYYKFLNDFFLLEIGNRLIRLLFSDNYLEYFSQPSETRTSRQTRETSWKKLFSYVRFSAEFIFIKAEWRQKVFQ